MHLFIESDVSDTVPFGNTTAINLINLLILLSVSLPHFSCPPYLEYLCPCALILFKTSAPYKSFTYLLTYSVFLDYSEILKLLGAHTSSVSVSADEMLSTLQSLVIEAL